MFRLAAPNSTAATLLATYLSDPNFTFAAEDRLRWTGIAVPLTNGVTYAYTIASGVSQVNGSQMYLPRVLHPRPPLHQRVHLPDPSGPAAQIR